MSNIVLVSKDNSASKAYDAARDKFHDVARFALTNSDLEHPDCWVLRMDPRTSLSVTGLTLLDIRVAEFIRGWVAAWDVRGEP